MPRKVEARGAIRTAATTEELAAALDVFVSLHRARWQGRGSHLGRPDLRERLGRVAAGLGVARLRVTVVEVDGRAAGVQVFVSGGRRWSYWNGGWDPAHAALKPGWVALLTAIGDAAAHGAEVIDLGPGDHEYKRRLATGNEPVVIYHVLPIRARGLPAAVALVPGQAKAAARRVERRLIEARGRASRLRCR